MTYKFKIDFIKVVPVGDSFKLFVVLQNLNILVYNFIEEEFREDINM
eukprot:CAMPEP_0116935666 /NCGR_PEP_ID=MMETSP0467-20121206/30426_1 /TAXON_ID=283647 /ORGANISM="Mesodinium pulex, Strain SPMC105" /LENGTH=46 /DNA_ID= /DNA_START= /DNA_END= /DNA_ORIENTATION=